jgi:hypothetical protein
VPLLVARQRTQLATVAVRTGRGRWEGSGYIRGPMASVLHHLRRISVADERVTFVALAVAAVLIVPGSARAAPTLDQQQSLMNTTISYAVGGDSDEKFAQVVTSGVAGLLSEVRVPLVCGSAASVTLEINNADTSPGGTTLARSTFPGSLFPGPSGFMPMPLGTPPFIPAETQFAVILSASGSCGVVPGPDGDPYSRGNAYFDARPNPPGVWVCQCDFANTPYDLAFQTFVERICEVPHLVGTAGSDGAGTLREYGCAAGTVTSAYSLSIAAGEVISQGQPEGTRLAAGSRVDFVVSLGKPPCRVPNVRGKSLAKARSAIARANCRLGAVRRVPSVKALKGRVIRQQPPAGSRRPYRARVRLVIGRGGRQ